MRTWEFAVVVLCFCGLSDGFFLPPILAPLGHAHSLREVGCSQASRLTRSLMQPKRPHAVRRKPGVSARILIEPIEPQDLDGFRRTASFFVTAFWDDYKAEVSLKGEVLKRVGNEQFVDMKSRYGPLKMLPATMLIAKNDLGEIVGCCGVELALVSGNKVMPKTRTNFDQGYDVQPLLANVAVDARYRGQGIARLLCAAGEQEVFSWGYEDVLLLVEAENTPAMALYKKMGYKEVFRDSDVKASKAVAYSGGSTALQTVKVCITGMKKKIKTRGGADEWAFQVS